MLNATDQALLVGGFLHAPPAPCERCGNHVHAHLTFSFEKGPWQPPAHLILAAFDSPESAPSPPRLKGSRPEVPHPCALDLCLGGLLALEGSHASRGVTAASRSSKDIMFP